MRKPYRNSTVHPSPPPPPPPPPPSSSDPLAFLPLAIFTLTSTLTPEDKQVLAYLILSHSSNSSFDESKGCAFTDHSVAFNCSCFRCYMSYWVRWDSSPNRQLIHEIIELVENDLVESEVSNKAEKGSKKSRRKKVRTSLTELTRSELTESTESELTRERVENDDEFSTSGDIEEDGKGLMKKFVSFVGERIWGVHLHGDKEQRN